jgi:hypothetical protein
MHAHHRLTSRAIAAVAVAASLALAAGGASGLSQPGGTGPGAEEQAKVRTDDLIIPAAFPADAPPAVPSLEGAEAVVHPLAVPTGIHQSTGCDNTCPAGNHWGRYRYNGGHEQAAVRAFWLFDRTGNAAANAALRDFTDKWNWEVRARQGAGQDIPYVAYFRDDANVGLCSPNPANLQAYQLPGYSILLACNGRVLDAMGRAIVIPGGPHWGTTVLPWVYVDVSDRSCNRGPMSHVQLVSAFAHEIGHVMGLDHRNGELTLMNTNASGVCAGVWFDGHDLDAIGAKYQHPAD